MGLENVAPLLGEYADLVMQKRAVEARIKELDADVRPLLTDRGSVVVGNYMMECRVNAGRKSLDKKAVAEAGINLEPFYKVGAPFTTLTVKEVENV